MTFRVQLLYGYLTWCPVRACWEKAKRPLRGFFQCNSKLGGIFRRRQGPNQPGFGNRPVGALRVGAGFPRVCRRFASAARGATGSRPLGVRGQGRQIVGLPGAIPLGDLSKRGHRRDACATKSSHSADSWSQANQAVFRRPSSRDTFALCGAENPLPDFPSFSVIFRSVLFRSVPFRSVPVRLSTSRKHRLSDGNKTDNGGIGTSFPQFTPLFSTGLQVAYESGGTGDWGRELGVLPGCHLAVMSIPQEAQDVRCWR